MKLALLSPLACLVGLGTAVGGVKKGYNCKDGSGHEGICQTSKDCSLRKLPIAGDCDQGLQCCGYVHCTEDTMTGFLCNTKSDCSELSGSTDYGGKCPGYGGDVGCCAILKGELGGAGDKVGTSIGLELVAGGDFGLGLGDKSIDSGGLGLGNNDEVFSSGEFVGLGQGDDIAANNGLFGLRYGNWWD